MAATVRARSKLSVLSSLVAKSGTGDDTGDDIKDIVFVSIGCFVMCNLVDKTRIT